MFSTYINGMESNWIKLISSKVKKTHTQTPPPPKKTQKVKKNSNKIKIDIK